MKIYIKRYPVYDYILLKKLKCIYYIKLNCVVCGKPDPFFFGNLTGAYPLKSPLQTDLPGVDIGVISPPRRLDFVLNKTCIL